MSSTSTTAGREAEESRPTRVTLPPLNARTADTHACDWMAGGGGRANGITVAPAKQQSKLNDQININAKFIK